MSGGGGSCCLTDARVGDWLLSDVGQNRVSQTTAPSQVPMSHVAAQAVAAHAT